MYYYSSFSDSSIKANVDISLQTVDELGTLHLPACSETTFCTGRHSLFHPLLRIFNLLLSTAMAFGVKDYCAQPVNLPRLEWAWWKYEQRFKSVQDEWLPSPFPGPLLDWGWDAPVEEAQGSGDTPSLSCHCDPCLHLCSKWKTGT